MKFYDDMVDQIPQKRIYCPEINGNPIVYIGDLTFEIRARVVHHVIRTRGNSRLNKAETDLSFNLRLISRILADKEGYCRHHVIIGLIMDRCVLLTSTPSCVVSPRGETTHSGVDVNNTHLSMINPLNTLLSYIRHFDHFLVKCCLIKPLKWPSCIMVLGHTNFNF